jgi:hypothetical protein
MHAAHILISALPFHQFLAEVITSLRYFRDKIHTQTTWDGADTTPFKRSPNRRSLEWLRTFGENFPSLKLTLTTPWKTCNWTGLWFVAWSKQWWVSSNDNVKYGNIYWLNGWWNKNIAFRSEGEVTERHNDWWLRCTGQKKRTHSASILHRKSLRGWSILPTLHNCTGSTLLVVMEVRNPRNMFANS